MRWSKYLVSEASRGDYYTHDGDGNRAAPTQWHGPEELLRSYGIDPDKAVELKHLRPLMHGFDPVKKVAIRPAGSDKTRVAAIDLTYSAPKDVSALWATSSPYRRAQIEVAHKQAVKSALERTERDVTVVRRKQNKVQRFETAKALISAEALHTTSRLGKDQDADGIPDPQLHSHIAVIAAQRKDGKMAAVESRQLMLSAREGGAWYRSELAANLRELGVDIERRAGNDGRYFDLRGVSKKLSEHWSKRGQEVNRAAEAFRRKYNREPGPGELDNLVLSTRGSKSAAKPEEISAAWRALGEEHGLTAKRSEELFHSQQLENKPIDLREELLAEITKVQATINTHELKAKAYELSAGVCRPADANKLLNELHRSGELLQLKDHTWTTRQHRTPKQPTNDTAKRPASQIAAPTSERSLEQAEPEIEGKVPTAQLKEVHRTDHEWEREAREQIRAGEPGPPLAQYRAHDRLHLHDTRAEAAEAMVNHWDRIRWDFPGTRNVMITDAPDSERDELNSMAQQRRADAGELGARQVELPGKPYRLRAGDEVIFTAQFHPPAGEPIENGITATVIRTSRDEDQSQVTIRTNEDDPREFDVDTREFSELSLSYAVHPREAQNITAETSDILIGDWQTNKEHAYAALSRAREDTQIYTSRKDLGEIGMDTGAIERLADHRQGSRAQEASITREITGQTPQPIEQTAERPADTPQRIDEIEHRAETMREKGADEPTIVKQIAKEDAGPDASSTRTTREQQRREREIASIVEKQRQRRLDEEQRLIDRHRDNDRNRDPDRTTNERPSPTAEPGAARDSYIEAAIQQERDRQQAWQRDTEPDRDRDIQQAIQDEQDRQQAWQRDTERDRDVNRPGAADRDNERHLDKQAPTERGDHPIDHGEHPGRDVDRHGRVDRDTWIKEALQKEQERQQAWEQGIDSDRDNDRHPDKQAPTEPDERSIDHGKYPERDIDQPDRPDRDSIIEQAIQEERDRQRDWEQGIDQDRDNDRDFGIE